jgi:AbrB family looped-hinge helix DNA binding protein
MPGYEVTVNSKGQVTLPAELRARLNLKAGDMVEFYLDLSGRVLMRPQSASDGRIRERSKTWSSSRRQDDGR